MRQVWIAWKTARLALSTPPTWPGGRQNDLDQRKRKNDFTAQFDPQINKGGRLVCHGGLYDRAL